MSRFPSEAQTKVVAVEERGAIWMELPYPGELHHAPFPWDPNDRANRDLESLGILRGLISTNERVIWLLGHATMPCWLQVPPPGTRSLRELQAVARIRSQEWMNPAKGSRESLIHANWNARVPFLCESLPSLWSEILSQAPRVITPLRLGLAKLCENRPSPGWYAITTPDEAHLLLRRGGHWQQLRSLRIPNGNRTADIAGHLLREWRRELLRLGDPEDQLRWVHLGHTDSEWSDKTVQWFDASWQQGIRSLPTPTTPAGDLSAAAHLLWMFTHLSTSRIKP